jgi:hypothetical protein
LWFEMKKMTARPRFIYICCTRRLCAAIGSLALVAGGELRLGPLSFRAGII